MHQLLYKHCFSTFRSFWVYLRHGTPLSSWDPIVFMGPHCPHRTPLSSWDPIVLMGPHYPHGTPLFLWDPIILLGPHYPYRAPVSPRVTFKNRRRETRRLIPRNVLLYATFEALWKDWEWSWRGESSFILQNFSRPFDWYTICMRFSVVTSSHLVPQVSKKSI